MAKVVPKQTSSFARSDFVAISVAFEKAETQADTIQIPKTINEPQLHLPHVNAEYAMAAHNTDFDPHDVQAIVHAALMHSDNLLVKDALIKLMTVAKMVLDDEELPLHEVRATVADRHRTFKENHLTWQQQVAYQKSVIDERDDILVKAEAKLKKKWLSLLDKLEAAWEAVDRWESKMGVWDLIFFDALRENTSLSKKRPAKGTVFVFEDYRNLDSPTILKYLKLITDIHQDWIVQQFDARDNDETKWLDYRMQKFQNSYFKHAYAPDPYDSWHNSAYERRYIEDYAQQIYAEIRNVNKQRLALMKRNKVDGYDYINY